jgi:hypothetical protein
MLSQIIRTFPPDQPLKFGTLTLPAEVEASKPSNFVVATESAVWRRFTRYFRVADPLGRVFVWKREVGSRGGRLHRHCAIVTSLSNVKLKRLAWRAGAGRIVNFKLATNAGLAVYLAKYIAKPGHDLSRWPSRTRWAQTIFSKVPFQGPPPKGWIVHRFGRLTSERQVLSWFDAQLTRRSHKEAQETLCQLARRDAATRIRARPTLQSCSSPRIRTGASVGTCQPCAARPLSPAAQRNANGSSDGTSRMGGSKRTGFSVRSPPCFCSLLLCAFEPFLFDSFHARIWSSPHANAHNIRRRW